MDKEMSNDTSIIKKIKNMSNEEYEAFLKEQERNHTASVEDVINFLLKTYKPTDKLCWIDCVEGCKYECKPIFKSDLGKNRFIYVKKDKERIIKESPKCNPLEYYPYVDDNDILIN